MYCQLGKTQLSQDSREVFVPERCAVREIKRCPEPGIDYITFSGAGEPTLARNLGVMIEAVKKIRIEKIAVITNSSLMARRDVTRSLLKADFVIAKLDAHSEKLFAMVNRPVKSLSFEAIISGLKKFRQAYRGRLALQCMFTSLNKRYAENMAKIAKMIGPDEVQINTPLRPCGVKPLSKKDLKAIEVSFKKVCGLGTSVVNVYAAKNKKVTPISGLDTLKRRGKS